MKYQILGFFLLVTCHNAWPCNYTNSLMLNDLGFYNNAIGCLESYFYCEKNLKKTNKNINCLQNSECNHVQLLEALINLPYVQNNILSEQQKLDTNNLLITYGKYNLELLVSQYPSNITSNLINDLTKILNTTDLKALINNNLQLVPPAGFIEEPVN